MERWGRDIEVRVDGPMHDEDQAKLNGSIAVGTGIGSVVRIPVPGTEGLHVELSPRGWRPPGGSTSALFIQDVAGKRVLRLDYGYNPTTGTVDYHWNQQGVHDDFRIRDHTSVGRGGQALYKAAKYFKYAGRVLVVVGAAADIYSIVVARKRWRQVVKVAAGWAGAAVGCKVVGAGGAYIGSAWPGVGTAVGGLVGCAAGGAAGYFGLSLAAGETYDWVEETFFEPVPEMPSPP